MRGARWIITFSLTFYIAVLALLYFGQSSFIYLPATKWVEPSVAGAANFKTVEIGDGAARLRGWWRIPPDSKAPVILHFHGNGGSIAGRARLYQTLVGDEYGLLAAEYPGYAGNPGSPGEEAFHAAAQAHYDWLIASGYRAEQIIIAGQSLGTGVAVRLASRNAAAGLLLEAPYSSIADVAAQRAPFIPVRLLLNDHYDSMALIKTLEMPLAWAHGTDDEVIDHAFGKRLFTAANQPKCAHVIAGAGHNNLWQYDIADFFRANVASMTAGRGCSPPK